MSQNAFRSLNTLVAFMPNLKLRFPLQVSPLSWTFWSSPWVATFCCSLAVVSCDTILFCSQNLQEAVTVMFFPQWFVRFKQLLGQFVVLVARVRVASASKMSPDLPSTEVRFSYVL